MPGEASLPDAPGQAAVQAAREEHYDQHENQAHANEVVDRIHESQGFIEHPLGEHIEISVQSEDGLVFPCMYVPLRTEHIPYNGLTNHLMIH